MERRNRFRGGETEKPTDSHENVTEERNPCCFSSVIASAVPFSTKLPVSVRSNTHGLCIRVKEVQNCLWSTTVVLVSRPSGRDEAPEKKETYSAKCACGLAWVSGESGFESLHRQFFCVGITRFMISKFGSYFIRLSPLSSSLSSSLFSRLFQLRKSLSLSKAIAKSLLESMRPRVASTPGDHVVTYLSSTLL